MKKINNIYKIDSYLYCTDDSKIEKGDCALYGEEISENNPTKGMHPYKVEYPDQCHWNDIKIIATTNKSLGLPMVEQDLIKQYCENPVESVMVEYENQKTCEPPHCLDLCDSCERVTVKLKDNCIIISPIEEKMYSKEEIIEQLSECLLEYRDYAQKEGLTLKSMSKFKKEWIKENLL